MNDLQSDVLSSSSPVSDRIEGMSRGTGFDVQIHRTRWLDHGEGLFLTRTPFIEMFCNASRLVKGRYDHLADRSDYVRLGEISFVRHQEPLLCRWERGSQRSISCMFDIEAIARRAGFEWDWPDFDRAAALSIRNDYIGASLRRIAAETLSPGFASEIQIETLFLSIAFELHRHFTGEARIDAAPPGRLNRRQLDDIRAIAIETPGDPPSIADLAGACGMNPRQLATRYRATTGQTLRSFLAEGRLERARMLLRDQRMLIKQVAFECGFKSSAAFAAAFQRRMGMTPQAFRGTVAVH